MSASAMVDPKEREVLDHAFPDDLVVDLRLVALADVDGSGLRPARQADFDPVDFLVFGIAVAGSSARIDLGDWPQLRGMRGQLCRRISPDLRHRGSVVTAATPPLASLSR